MSATLGGMDDHERYTKNTLRNDDTGCVLWTGYIQPNGYAYITVGSRADNSRRRMAAHRWAYELFKESIPDGLTIDHLCRVPHCVNPDHLEAVTMRENLHRGRTVTARNASRTHCPRGHPYSGDNLYVFPNGNRGCRACHRAANRRRYRELRGGNVATANSDRTHCPQGHPYDEANTRINATNGSRQCRACDRERARAKRPGLPSGGQRKSHCLRGHPMDGDNLYVTPRGIRECRACRRITRAAKRN